MHTMPPGSAIPAPRAGCRRSPSAALAVLLTVAVSPLVWAQREAGAPPSARPAEGAVLIHYWSFDTIPNDVDFSTTTPELLDPSSRLYGAFLAYAGARWDRANDPTPLNARDTPYVADLDRVLRLRNPAGPLTLELPTSGYRDVVLRYAVTRTGNGPERQEIAYSLDAGRTFLTAGLPSTSVAVDEGAWKLVEIDLSGIAGADDNPGFQVRLTPAGAGSDPSDLEGNQRVNSVTLEGHALADTGRILIHHWEFDTIPNDVNFQTGVEIGAGGALGGRSAVSGAWIRYDGARWDRVNDPTPFNARTAPYDPERDRAIRIRNPTGAVTLRLPTTGHRDVVFRYAVKRSGSGAREQQVAYSTDGSTFVTTGLRHDTVQVGEQYILHVLDFSGVAAVNDNPAFTIRITPSGAGSEPGNLEGNQRFDHITVDARPAGA